MIDYSPARKEIKAAKRCLESMRTSNTYEDFEEYWRETLGHIEKSFTKLLSATNAVKSKFTSTFSKEFMYKKNDQLLVYLTQARNADTHTVADISQKIPARTAITSPPGIRDHYIHYMAIKNYLLVDYVGDPIIVTFHPEDIETIAVKNQGNIYPPPLTHLGEKITTRRPFYLAEKGIIFYEAWIDKSSNIFK